MLVAVIADIHANAAALEALAADLARADRVICLGDMTGYYCEVNETLDALRRLDALCVLGNHDAMVLAGGAPSTAGESVRFGVEFAARVITPAHRAWLQSLPTVWGGIIDGHSWLAAHGSPWRPLDDYLYADSPLLADIGRFDCDLLLAGQTHRPLHLEGRPALLNPGSVGQSRHRPAVACAALVDTASLAAELVERPYNPAPVIALARENGAGSWIEHHLAG